MRVRSILPPCGNYIKICRHSIKLLPLDSCAPYMCSCSQTVRVPVPAHRRAGAPWRHAHGTLHHLPPLPRPAPPRPTPLTVALDIGWLCTQGHPAGGTLLQCLPDFLWKGSTVKPSFAGRGVATFRIYRTLTCAASDREDGSFRLSSGTGQSLVIAITFLTCHKRIPLFALHTYCSICLTVNLHPSNLPGLLSPSERTGMMMMMMIEIGKQWPKGSWLRPSLWSWTNWKHLPLGPNGTYLIP